MITHFSTVQNSFHPLVSEFLHHLYLALGFFISSSVTQYQKLPATISTQLSLIKMMATISMFGYTRTNISFIIWCVFCTDNSKPDLDWWNQSLRQIHWINMVDINRLVWMETSDNLFNRFISPHLKRTPDLKTGTTSIFFLMTRFFIWFSWFWYQISPGDSCAVVLITIRPPNIYWNKLNTSRSLYTVVNKDYFSGKCGPRNE